MNVTISIDHRASDGAEAAKFMLALGEYLENPVSMLL
jgi:pyruvate/2-oxoglutarate dehydrogenase complex dihydrolipoamide acyltransferase (E2) component